MEHASSSARFRPSLRTYSKRKSSDTGSSEPSTKKRRASGNDVDIHTIAGRFAQKSDTPARPTDQKEPQLPALPLPAQQAKKGTIFNYFKVRSPSSETKSPCMQSSEPLQPSSTPPSSPPTSEPPRKKSRRLTTKPSLKHRVDDVQEHGEPPLKGDDVEHRISEATATEPGPLGLITAEGLNRERGREVEEPNAGSRGSSKKQKAKQATVQTTLSLSLTEKQFVECTVCNMLYNPYHEKDVQMHKKRHAAVMRSKKVAIDRGE